ncbi:MAG: hypothetical protein RIR05_1024 [Bacteroidota bacterium]|jgi:cation diffusion facilitator family transporter|nr:cation transporter [Bacteroidia bacterium]NBY09523.1 cation transporter [Sphingobacteriia bacterium]
MQIHIETKISTMKWVLGIGILLMGIKFLAFFLTASNAILTDALESIVNVLAGAFTLWSLYFAAQPKDKNHPYGHGKIEFFASAFEGGMILLAGLFMIYKAIHGFLYPPQLQALHFGIFLTVFSGFINFILARRLIKTGKALSSTSMVADGTHLLTDTWSSLGLVIGLICIQFTSWVIIDSILTIILGALIIWTGFKLVRESIFHLLDKADISQLENVIKLLNSIRESDWIDLHHVRIQKHGAVLHIDAHMTLPWYYTLNQVHQNTASLESKISNLHKQELEFNIHADPCIPDSCKICSISTCKHRIFNFERQLPWTIDNLITDHKHRIAP